MYFQQKVNIQSFYEHLSCSLFEILSTSFLEILFGEGRAAVQRLALLQWRSILIRIYSRAFEISTSILILFGRSNLLVAQVSHNLVSIETCAVFFICQTRVVLPNSARILSFSAGDTTLSRHYRLFLFYRGILSELRFLSKNIHHTVL